MFKNEFSKKKKKLALLAMLSLCIHLGLIRLLRAVIRVIFCCGRSSPVGDEQELDRSSSTEEIMGDDPRLASVVDDTTRNSQAADWEKKVFFFFGFVEV